MASLEGRPQTPIDRDIIALNGAQLHLSLIYHIPIALNCHCQPAPGHGQPLCIGSTSFPQMNGAYSTCPARTIMYGIEVGVQASWDPPIPKFLSAEKMF